MNNTPAPTPQPKSKFTLGMINQLIALPFIAIPLIHASHMLQLKDTYPYDSYAVSYFAGILFAAVCYLLLFRFIAWSVFRFTKGNGTSGRWVFAILAISVMVAQAIFWMNRENQIKQQIASQKQLNQSVRRFQNSVDEQINEGGLSSSTAKQINKIQNQFDQSVQSMTGEQRKYAEVISAFNHEMIDLTNQYQQADKAFNQVGGNSLAGVTKLAQLDERIKLADRVCELSDTLVKFVTEVPDTLHKRLIENGVSTEYADRALALSLPSFHLDLLLDAHRLGNDIDRHRRELLIILKDGWGNWQYNEEAGKVTIYDKDMLTKYGEAATELGSLNGKMREAAQALIAAQRGGGG